MPPNDPTPDETQRPPEATRPADTKRDTVPSVTYEAPTFADPTGSLAARTTRRATDAHQPMLDGSRIDDFEIIKILGHGAFGIVYLAKQVSLNRLVALKVTPNQGSEGRTLAQLEHENIVQVFSETLSSDGQQRLLCMQYVAGTTLDAVIRTMHGQQKSEWGGASILKLIDDLNPDPPPFSPTGLRERQQLAGADWVEAICWIGSQLAEALAYAHGKQVLHRDIKPANILQSQYGRPLLADFNLAFQTVDLTAPDEALFGGTLAYMSPEHLDAFHPDRDTKAEQVDSRSDIFSLGIVLYEMASGDVALPPNPPTKNNLRKLEMIAEARQQLPPSIARDDTMAERVFDRTIVRCLEPQASGRYQQAAELAAALNGCRELRLVEAQLPAPGPITRSAMRHPFFWLVLLMVLPHVIGSAVNITYNSWRIMGHLSDAQREAFTWLVVAFNVIVYPLCCGWLAKLVIPVYRTWGKMQADLRQVDCSEIDRARRETLIWPRWAVLLASLGWFPGGLFFPIGLRLLTGPIEPWVYQHFLISCTLSGLIAMTYSYFAIQYLATRIFYPALWCEVHDLRATVNEELGSVPYWLTRFQFIAGLVPLLGAILIVFLGPENGSSYATFAFLVVTLIVLGFCGFQLANNATLRINQTIRAMTIGLTSIRHR